MPASSSDLAPLADLTAVTWQLLDGLGHDRVRVDRLGPHLGAWWGQTDGRSWVAYQDPAPWWVVAHEVAHILTGADHDDREWTVCYLRLLSVVLAIADHHHQARLASTGDG